MLILRKSAEQLVNVLQGKYTLQPVTCVPSLKVVVLTFHRESASCTHVSGLLHGLVSMFPGEFQPPVSPTQSAAANDEEEVLPITSYACRWKIPKKKKGMCNANGRRCF